MVVDAGGDILTLKRSGGWKSSGIAEGYVDDSTNKKIEIAKIVVYLTSSRVIWAFFGMSGPV
jgi:hypothetical protein